MHYVTKYWYVLAAAGAAFLVLRYMNNARTLNSFTSQLKPPGASTTGPTMTSNQTGLVPSSGVAVSGGLGTRTGQGK